MKNSKYVRTIKKISIPFIDKLCTEKVILFNDTKAIPQFNVISKNVYIYSTPDDLLFLVPSGMTGIEFRKWHEFHSDEINDWIASL
jgi:hypothetical protein